MIYQEAGRVLSKNTQLRPTVGENDLIVVILIRRVCQRAKSVDKKLNEGYLNLLDDVIDQIVIYLDR